MAFVHPVTTGFTRRINGTVACAIGVAAISMQWSCAASAVTEPSTPEPDYRTRAPVATPQTIGEASVACAQVQQNSAVPIACKMDYVEGVPSMFVGFNGHEEATKWMPLFSEQVATPYCYAANRNERKAWVYMVVTTKGGKEARRWSCELGSWSDWFTIEAAAPVAQKAAAQPTPAQRPLPQAPSIADAIRACQNIQSSRQIPVTCSTEYLEGITTMIIGFPTPEEADKNIEAMAEHVGDPFCNAANRVSRRAALVVTVANSYARPYDCEQQRWGEWFELSQAEQQRTLH